MIPRSSRVRRLVLFVFVLGGSFLGALFFALTASAQTATPTPTATVTPIWYPTPDPTMTPVWADPDPSFSDVVWWWVLDKGAAPIGTWASQVDVTRRSYCAGSCNDYDPAEGSTYIVLSPPSMARVVTFTCSYAGITVGDSHTGTGYWSNQVLWRTGNLSSSPDTSVIDYTLVSGDKLEVLSGRQSQVGTMTYRAVVLSPYSAFPAAGTIPTYEQCQGSQTGQPIRLLLSTFAGTSHSRAQAGASARLVCRVDSFERFDGSVVVPRVPVVGDSGHDWVPWGDWDPVEWVAAPPTTGGFGFGDEVEGDCFTIVPGYQYTVPVPSWIGEDLPDDLPIGWPSREVCVIERDLDVVLFGMDLGQMAYVWVMLSAVFWMISVWRRG